MVIYKEKAIKNIVGNCFMTVGLLFPVGNSKFVHYKHVTFFSPLRDSVTIPEKKQIQQQNPHDMHAYTR